MNDLVPVLKKSLEYIEMKKLIERQRNEIALLHARNRVLELKLHRQMEAQHGLPSLLREA